MQGRPQQLQHDVGMLLARAGVCEVTSPIAAWDSKQVCGSGARRLAWLRSGAPSLARLPRFAEVTGDLKLPLRVQQEARS